MIFTLGNLLSQEAAGKKPEKPKFQIQIEDELEEAGKSSNEENKKTEEIVITGEDEQLIRTFKSDTSFISPTDASSMRWIDDKSLIDKDGKNKIKNNEKNGDFVSEYGMYDNFLFNGKITKSDRFGLYQLLYSRNNLVSEGINGNRVNNSAKTIDDLNVNIGVRLLPQYFMMFNAKYKGDSEGLQENTSYQNILRRWAGFTLKNNIKPDNKQMINVDLYGNYLQPRYGALALPEAVALYLDTGIQANWIYIFENKISIETIAAVNFLSLKDIDQVLNKASTVKAQVLFHFPIVRANPGSGKNRPWQLDLTAGGGGFYKDTLKIEPVASVYIDSKFDIWKFRLGGEKVIENLKMEESHLQGYQEKPLFYQMPLNYWHFYMANGFTINKENAVLVRAGYKQYDVYYNPVIDSNMLYYRTPIAYKEIYGRINWEFQFLRNFLLETSIDLNIGLNAVNMRPLAAFLVILNYDTEKFSAALSLKAASTRKIDSITLKDYYLVGLNLKYWLTPSFAIIARGENLLNQQYMEYYPYQTSGIKIFAGCYLKI